MTTNEAPRTFEEWVRTTGGTLAIQDAPTRDRIVWNAALASLPSGGCAGLVKRLEAASRDERLCTGMLYREAADAIKALERERDEWRGAAYRVGESIGSIGPNGYYLYTAQQWADWAVPALQSLAAQLAEKDAECVRLQQALYFWMPSIAGVEHPAGDRAANDSCLLVGFGIKDEPSAEELGWIKVDAAIDSARKP